MLRKMRSKASSWMIKVLLGLIVAVFVFWGVGSFRDPATGYVATVNGQQISVEQYRETYNTLMQQIRQRFGENLTPEMLEMLQVKKQTMDQLIAQTVMIQEAERLNIVVTDEELKDAIRSMNVFQRDGAFDPKVYQMLLGRIRMTPEGFEVKQRQLMLTGKIRDFVTGTVKVSEFEAREWFEWENAQIKIDIATFAADSYSGISPSEEEIKTYYESHKQRYKDEQKVKVRYLSFNADAYRAKVDIQEEDIKYFYEDHLGEYAEPKTVEARHILIKVDQAASEESVEEARKRAMAVLGKARAADQDFAELAKAYSEGPSKVNGGSLGAFQKEQMVQPFSEKAFSLQAGEISDLVRTQFGWHIIKVDKINEAKTLTLAEASPQIREQLTGEGAKNLAYDEAEAVFETALGGDDLVQTAEARGLVLSTTDFFTRREGPKVEMPDRNKFITAAFDVPVMEVGDILDLTDGFYIIQAIEKLPEKTAEFSTVKDKVTTDLIAEKQAEKASADAGKLLATVKGGGDLSEESTKSGVETVSTDFFKRNDSIPASSGALGRIPSINTVAFKLSQENRFPETVIAARKEYYVIEFKEKKLPGPEAFEKEKAGVMERVAQQKRYKNFDMWLAQLKEKSDISIEKDFL